ncbi:dynein axonemal assembly factor 3-like [Periophthalmus magnuspinnatus]|uniref:dynein axonemal assembly factor 3-like n=1 Tax=Periophthalmus magnuspinnatus TaxID=409849 RepID=UPI00145B5B66|nr:dynein axonemal assembly factor 3-like [Periophthalmus magnuspinnatus]
MSAGRASEGAGSVSLWGFSPSLNLLTTGRKQNAEKANILLVGSGDPRHILKTIAELPDKHNLHVWVIENNMEVMARQMLMLYLALMPHDNMGLREKTEVFLEIFGNSEVRSHTAETLRHAASRLIVSVTETMEEATHPCLDTSLLKFKERDELVRIFKQWTQPEYSVSGHPTPIVMSKAWDYRVRQHLGTRYDSRMGCFDWDLIMKLHEKGGRLIHKHQYTQWRAGGVAFELREGVYQTLNPTFLSSRVFSQKMSKVAVTGYWGDIVSSPYLSFGIETDDKSLLKTQNGHHIKTAQDVSVANVQTLFLSLYNRQGSPTTPDEEKQVPSTHNDPKCVSVNDLLHLDGISVTFLPMDALRKMPQKEKYSSLFNVIFFSVGCIQQLDPALRQIAAPDAVLVMELAKFILDLNKEQESGFTTKVKDIAQEYGFEPLQEETTNDVFAIFTPQR